jgi:polyhydroxyalkanoate synthesis regulator phasin
MELSRWEVQVAPGDLATEEGQTVMTELGNKPVDDDVQGHSASWSDENLKQAIAEVEDALAKLRDLDAPGDDVQGHASMYSDETLKQAIESLSEAVASLRNLGPRKSEDAEGKH